MRNPSPIGPSEGAKQNLHAAALGGTNPVVRLGGDVGDGADLQASGLQGADRGLAPRAGALDEDVDLLHPVLLGLAGGGFSSHLRGVGGGFARALEADLAGGGPGDDGAGGVGDGDDGVVERRLDEGVALVDVLAGLAARFASSSRGTRSEERGVGEGCREVWRREAEKEK